MTLRALVPLLALLQVGCGPGPGPEQLADLAAADGRWGAAFEALAGAGSEPRILGKRAEAALQAGRLSTAADDWARLARFDSTRQGEAAVGLARVAAAAERQGDAPALSRAVVALRTVAPRWPVGRLALSLRVASGAPDADAPLLVPAILAAAPARDVADDALYALARSVEEREGCEAAVPLLGVVVRRAVEPLTAHAVRALAGCRLALGLRALADGDTARATVALEASVDLDPAGVAGRRALLTLGDVHLGRGDLFGAQLAWQAVATAPAEPDSITALALDRLQARPATDAIGAADQP